MEKLASDGTVHTHLLSQLLWWRHSLSLTTVSLRVSARGEKALRACQPYSLVDSMEISLLLS